MLNNSSLLCISRQRYNIIFEHTFKNIKKYLFFLKIGSFLGIYILVDTYRYRPSFGFELPMRTAHSSDSNKRNT